MAERTYRSIGEVDWKTGDAELRVSHITAGKLHVIADRVHHLEMSVSSLLKEARGSRDRQSARVRCAVSGGLGGPPKGVSTYRLANWFCQLHPESADPFDRDLWHEVADAGVVLRGLGQGSSRKIHVWANKLPARAVIRRRWAKKGAGDGAA